MKVGCHSKDDIRHFFVAMILQAFVVPDVYLTYALIPVALLMLVFSLETPDYRKLIKTIGLNSLADEALVLELAAKNGEPEKVEANHEALLTHYKDSVDAINRR